MRDLFTLADRYRNEYRSQPDKNMCNFAVTPFAAVPSCVILHPNLCAHSVRVYGYLLLRLQQHEDCFPSMRTMADDLRISANYACDIIGKLKAQGLIKIVKKRKPGQSYLKNYYTLAALPDVVGERAFDTVGLLDFVRKKEREAEAAAADHRIEHELVELEPAADEDESCLNIPLSNTSDWRSPTGANSVVQLGLDGSTTREVQQVEKEQVEAPGETPGVPTAQNSNTTQLRDIISKTFGSSKVVLPDPGEERGLQRLSSREKRLQREERKAVKAEEKTQKMRDIVAGVLGSSQTPGSAIYDHFQERMLAQNLFCEVKPSVKDRARWMAFVESLGGLDPAKQLVSYVVDNWSAICQTHPKLNGGLPGIGLFQSAWRHEFIKAVFAGGNGAKPTTDGTDAESIKYREMAELAALMVAKKKGEVIDGARYKELYSRGHTGYLSEHLEKLGHG